MSEHETNSSLLPPPQTNSIARVQLSVKNDFPLEQQARDVIDALDQFILDCS